MDIASQHKIMIADLLRRIPLIVRKTESGRFTFAR
jgi:hypothetical protein